MNIELIKVKENETVVWYLIQTIVPGDTYLSKSGNIRYKLITKQGILFYDKISDNIEFEKNETDEYFFSSEHFMNSVRSIVRGRMKKYNKEGFFPETTGIATG